MAEWRLLRGWSTDELKIRTERLATAGLNFDATEAEMTGARGWQHYHSEAVIAVEPEGDTRFERARVALANYQFSDPATVTAHFDPTGALLMRRILLEIKVLGLRYLCPALVTHVRDESTVYGFRYDTLEGHIERGVEWFLLSKNEEGEIRFRIEARWKHGELPNWWSRVGFLVLAGRYQRQWHLEAHRRLSLLAHYGSLVPPGPDASGLTHQGVDVTFTYHQTKVALMKRSFVTRTLALGAITGIRSMSGLAAMALRHGVLARVMPLLAAAEMATDKTSVVGNRTDAIPLAGRAVMGAVVGAVIARDERQSMLVGGVLGAAAAVVAAHLAFQVRRRLPVPSAWGGVLEDLLVVGVGASYKRAHAPS